jgi:DNA-binding PadR family transcriptional regulator
MREDRENRENFDPLMGWNPHHAGGPWGRWFGGMQARRGDMRPIVLQMLTEKPMHGYEIIRALEDKSHGFWRPSPGSIYPTLQLLEEEDLVTSQETQGKKVYTLTPKGREEAGRQDVKAPWDCDTPSEHSQARHHFKAVAGQLRDLFPNLKQIAFTGSDADRQRAHDIMADAKAQLQTIIDHQQGNNHE